MSGEQGQKRISLRIHEVIYTQQQENGLRHEDFHRYRQYCARRIHKIRSSLKFLNQGKKFETLEYPQVIEDPLYLQIPLVDAERAWAAAVSLKAEYALDDDNTRLRLHAIRRFAKAVQWAQELEALALKHADQTTQLEATAYRQISEARLAADRGQYRLAVALGEAAKGSYDVLSRLLIAPKIAPATQFRLDAVNAEMKGWQWQAEHSKEEDRSDASRVGAVESVKEVAGPQQLVDGVSVPSTASEPQRAAVGAAVSLARKTRVAAASPLVGAVETQQLHDGYCSLRSSLRAALEGMQTAVDGETVAQRVARWSQAHDELTTLSLASEIETDLLVLVATLNRFAANVRKYTVATGAANFLREESRLVKKSSSRQRLVAAAEGLSVPEAAKACEALQHRLAAFAEHARAAPADEAPESKAGALARVDASDAGKCVRANARQLVADVVSVIVLGLSHVLAASQETAVANKVVALRRALLLVQTAKQRSLEVLAAGAEKALSKLEGHATHGPLAVLTLRVHHEIVPAASASLQALIGSVLVGTLNPPQVAAAKKK